MSRSPLGRLAPRALAALLIITLGVAPVAAASPAELGGRVLDVGGGQPAASVTVHLVDAQGATPIVAASAVTSGDGSFVIDDAPAGEYRLLVETAAGSYLAPGQVTLAEGRNRPLALSIGNAKRDHGFGSETSQGLSTWGTWAIAGAIGVGALFVISEVTDDNGEDPASAF